jgi:hypothetical protein
MGIAILGCMGLYSRGASLLLSELLAPSNCYQVQVHVRQ